MQSNLRKHFEKYYSFFNGVASIFDLNGIYYHRKPFWMDNNLTSSEQDYLAIKGDWEKVGSNLEKAINSSTKK